MRAGVESNTQMAEIAARALAILDDPSAFLTPEQPALGPRPSPQLASVAAEFGAQAPMVAVRCGNYERCDGRRITKWRYEPQYGSVIPIHRETAASTQGAPPWLDRANAGKGPTETARGPGAKHDGLGTHNYTCPRCHRRVAVSAERRLRRYLTAVATGKREIFI